MIYLKTYDSETNPDAYLDSELSFEEQTAVCQKYIQTKQNATEEVAYGKEHMDEYTRPAEIKLIYSDGFTAYFKENYTDNYPPDYLIQSEVVINIEIGE
jgi:hypothetical protein